MVPKKKVGQPKKVVQHIKRLVPTQKRSRERFEAIIRCASDVLLEKGGDAFRMSDIVERTGVAFGSLYQYFPDKTALIGTIAERYNELGYECVRRERATISKQSDIQPALCRIADAYYQLYLDEPIMGSIWQATQADHMLQRIDEEAGALIAEYFTETLVEVAPKHSKVALLLFSQTMMIQIAAAVRYAITLEPKNGHKTLTLFKRMLPNDLSVLDT